MLLIISVSYYPVEQGCNNLLCPSFNLSRLPFVMWFNTVNYL